MHTSVIKLMNDNEKMGRENGPWRPVLGVNSRGTPDLQDLLDII